ncbi:MAG: hypothetical protein Q8O67_11345 [Deltaproteobacteria bacterium]|nr:hypothetical protein [Deltaproteobacteria bacterium]
MLNKGAMRLFSTLLVFIEDGIRWHALACAGMRWHALACAGMRWHALACAGMRWHALAFAVARLSLNAPDRAATQTGYQGAERPRPPFSATGTQLRVSRRCELERDTRPGQLGLRLALLPGRDAVTTSISPTCALLELERLPSGLLFRRRECEA